MAISIQVPASVSPGDGTKNGAGAVDGAGRQCEKSITTQWRKCQQAKSELFFRVWDTVNYLIETPQHAQSASKDTGPAKAGSTTEAGQYARQCYWRQRSIPKICSVEDPK